MPARALARESIPATIADLMAIPAAERFHEIIDGELVQKAMPSFEHGDAQSALVSRLNLQGTSYDNAVSLAKHFLEAVQWTK